MPKNWTKTQWQQVLRSGESKFEIIGSKTSLCMEEDNDTEHNANAAKAQLDRKTHHEQYQ